MSKCWPEGELRAWQDGELPARDMERLAAHMEQCAACSGMRDEVAARAARVGALLDCLAETPPARKLPPIPRRVRAGRLWATAAAGLAAAFLMAFLLSPRHGPVPQPRPPQAARKVAPSPPLQAPAALQVKPAIIRRRAPAKPKPHVDYYVALDDEPIETGVVVRVNLDAGPSGVAVPADVILGPDGRARAIRLVSDISGGRP
jgi:Putative zinc-finger